MSEVPAGNSGRLLEMLHGSHGWEKLVSELQQKEEEDVQRQAIQEEEEQQQQQAPAGRHKRGRPANPDANEARSVTTEVSLICTLHLHNDFITHSMTHDSTAVQNMQLGLIQITTGEMDDTRRRTCSVTLLPTEFG